MIGIESNFIFNLEISS